MAKLKRQIKKPAGGGLNRKNGVKAVGKKPFAPTKGGKMVTKGRKNTTMEEKEGGENKKQSSHDRWNKKKKDEDEGEEFDVAPKSNDLSHIIPKFPGKLTDGDGGEGEGGEEGDEDVNTRSMVQDQNKKNKKKGKQGGFQSMGKIVKGFLYFNP